MKNKILLALLAGCFLASCSGYQVGSLAHPQIKKIAIGKIKNETDEPRMAIFMIEKLKERIRQDGSFEIVNASDADVDVILNGTLTHFTYQQKGSIRQDDADNRNEDADDGYRADIYRSTIHFRYKIVTRNKWLVQSRKLSDYADFAETIDQNTERREALRRAAYNLSIKVIADLAEGW